MPAIRRKQYDRLMRASSDTSSLYPKTSHFLSAHLFNSSERAFSSSFDAFGGKSVIERHYLLWLTLFCFANLPRLTGWQALWTANLFGKGSQGRARSHDFDAHSQWSRILMRDLWPPSQRCLQTLLLRIEGLACWSNSGWISEGA